LIESRTVLELTHRTDRLPVFTLVSVVLFLAGFIAGMLMNNYFLSPVLAVGLSLMPWLYVLASATKFKQQLSNELEAALGMVTTSYLRSDNILMAVRENVDSLQYPVKEVFEKFLVQSSMISSDIPRLLEEMKQGIDNAVFNDWVDQIILCQENRTLKSTLQPIVARLSDVREVTGKLNSLLYQPLKDFIAIAVLTVLNFPFFYSLSREWYNTLMNTTIGQIIVAVTFVILFASLVAVVKCTKPVEYRR
jgi:Flp pilus assembly protein TadB